ncbi:MAG: hypothetical protein HFE49_03710 [Clostridia bacterium]|nr:hypothetical protein [Clostridia bacterium]
MEGRICCICGDKNITDKNTLKEIYDIMSALVQYGGVTTFYSEHLTDFDIICEMMVLSLKKRFRHLKLCVVMHYVTAMHPPKLPPYFDKLIVPKIMDEKSLKAIKYFIVNRSDCMIAYVEDKKSDVYKMLRYARKIGMFVCQCNI